MSAFDSGKSIIIDDYKFTLISKTEASSKGYYNKNYHTIILEERKKVVITSQNIKTGEEKRFFAYTSVSQLGTWRLCILEPNNRLNKFDNYIQATLIDIRLQNFINMNFDLLPYSESSDTFTRRLVENEIKSITKRGEQINDAFNYWVKNPSKTGEIAEEDYHRIEHFIERMKIYNDEKFEYKIYTLNLKEE